jgi:pSer/pThr/pTyr-binding forkhead associated (FHA) protein
MVEVVPFGATDEVTAPEPVISSITIMAPPPGIGEPPVMAGASAVPLATPTRVEPIAESLDETRASVRRRTGAHWRLVLSDGRHIEVASSLLVGRDPASNAKWPSAALLAIDDDAHSVSKTHAAFEVNGGDLWVTDLDSTNGIIITQSDGVELDIDPNVRAQLLPGADVELGDYIIQIEKD